MDTFPFTKQKLLKLPEQRRHKWICSWIRTTYQKLIDGSLTPHGQTSFLKNYHQLHQWLTLDRPESPKSNSLEFWQEYLSEQFHFHQQKTGKGIKEADLLPKVITGDQEIAGSKRTTNGYEVFLDDIRSAFNVGSIFRTCDATGFNKIFLGGSTASPENNQVQKAAMGADQWIDFELVTDAESFLSQKQSDGELIIGLETVEKAIPYHLFDWPDKALILVGNEEYGLSQTALSYCDTFITLPMLGLKNSINVANAFAVTAFQIQLSFLNKQTNRC